MKFDLRRQNKEDRKKFVRYANKLLSKERELVEINDHSGRTLRQNSYFHVLVRIMALETGVKEEYAKQIYFKKYANADIFEQVVEDPLTGEETIYYRKSSKLDIKTMAKAIDNFIMWAASVGYELPKAKLKDDDGTYEFESTKDKDSFHKAEIVTSRSPEID